MLAPLPHQAKSWSIHWALDKMSLRVPCGHGTLTALPVSCARSLVLRLFCSLLHLQYLAQCLAPKIAATYQLHE